MIVETNKIGQRLVITNPERAAEFMLQEWPSSIRGKAFARAQAVLLGALEGKTKPTTARKAFLDALTESQIYVFPE
ncbi:DUF982 domain-containing protein [Rhizobium sp. BK491]|uniref:DUF982 domain-containing protein n=1 Tax=Rhizobium sp. BK491 TaxID=2587009 RepID=UPI00160702B2|nr:hypothetical protein [Rhizobium sp. BK491]